MRDCPCERPVLWARASHRLCLGGTLAGASASNQQATKIESATRLEPLTTDGLSNSQASICGRFPREGHLASWTLICDREE